LLRLAKILAVVLLLAPISASPLGLGDIRPHSALNQQFDAEIDLIALGQTRIDDISVRLASREAFERAGIERPLFLSRLQFDVEAGPGDTASIRIRSDQPVREPFLNFLVEVNWPSGRLLREYTVLLDPPLFLDETPSTIQAPAASVAEPPARVVAPAPREAVPAAATPRTTPGRLSASLEISPDGSWSYGPVQRSDTLWSIAQEFRSADASVSIEQIMIALLRNNPEAFYNDNINELRAGHVLRLDDPSTIGLLGHAEAAAEARRQFAQWQDAKRMRAAAAEPRPLGEDEGEAMTVAGPAEASDIGPRLRLSAPDSADAERFAMSDLGESSPLEAAVVSRLREDLVAALEISESARQENLELRQQLAELEEQIGAMQRLLSLQDDTMAALQAGVASGVEAPVQPETTATETGVQPQPMPPVAAAPSLLSDFTGLLDTVLEDPMMLGAAVFLLLMLLTLGWLIVRRRQMAGATLEELAPTPAPESRGKTTVTTASTAAGAAAGVEGTRAAPVAGGLEEAIEEAVGAADEIGLDVMQPEEDEIDILAEADVYLAYRRFDKAEELLRDAIAAEPGRRDLLLKLFEVHAASGNSDAFIREAEALDAARAPGDEAIWDKVTVMGRRLAPEHALFAGAAVQAQQDSGAEAAAELGGNVDDVELDFSAGVDLSDETPDFSAETTFEDSDIDALAGNAPEPEGVADFDMTLDDETLAKLETGTGDFEAPEASVPDETPKAPFLVEAAGDESVGEGLSFVGESDAPADDSGIAEPADDDLEKQLLAAGAGDGGDVDWLSEIGNDLDFADMDGDEAGGDFSGLISGEDEVGTKLDLARAYIDMGDQDSARSILNEVTEEGNEAQQREANDLMRRIG
jgi:pilus assembly protein FimV